jgi:hypothetical protein
MYEIKSATRTYGKYSSLSAAESVHLVVKKDKRHRNVRIINLETGKVIK